jgi:hypothetical protein
VNGDFKTGALDFAQCGPLPTSLYFHCQCRTAPMILRRLIAWFRFERPQPLPPPPAVPETAGDREAAFDLAEFGRLLSSGKPEDLKKIARAMTLPHRVA